MTSPDARLDRSISIHALREEGDFGIRPERQRVNLFLSTPSARRATTSSKNKRTNDKNFYPRPPRGGRRGEFCRAGKSYGISIHALREEGDCSGSCSGICKSDFYPRPPRGGRPLLRSSTRTPRQFLSTPSARRATRVLFSGGDPIEHFYPRPPRGGRHLRDSERDLLEEFLSTPSARRATKCRGEMQPDGLISIHALREEGDYPGRVQRFHTRDFYPRPPRGGRPVHRIFYA